MSEGVRATLAVHAPAACPVAALWSGLRAGERPVYALWDVVPRSGRRLAVQIG
jgi:hypothetical protein